MKCEADNCENAALPQFNKRELCPGCFKKEVNEHLEALTMEPPLPPADYKCQLCGKMLAESEIIEHLHDYHLMTDGRCIRQVIHKV